MPFSIDSMIEALKANWYWITIGILGIVVIVLLLKGRKKGIQYYSQIEVNKMLKYKELEYNPTDIKIMKYKGKKWKVGGELIRGWYRRGKPDITQKATRIYTPKDIKNLEYEALKIEIVKGQEPDYITHDFLIRKGNFLGIPTGEKVSVMIKHGSFSRPKYNTIQLNDSVELVYYKGFLIDFDWDMFNVVADDSQRFMTDNQVDGMGFQQKSYSIVKTDYSHEDSMKDKEIEAEEKKDKAKRFGGRT